MEDTDQVLAGHLNQQVWLVCMRWSEVKKARRGSRATASHPRISYSVFWGTYMIAIPLALSIQMSGSPAVGIMGKGLSDRKGKCEYFMVHNGLTHAAARGGPHSKDSKGRRIRECTEEASCFVAQSFPAYNGYGLGLALFGLVRVNSGIYPKRTDTGSHVSRPIPGLEMLQVALKDLIQRRGTVCEH